MIMIGKVGWVRIVKVEDDGDDKEEEEEEDVEIIIINIVYVIIFSKVETGVISQVNANDERLFHLRSEKPNASVISHSSEK